MATNPQFSRSGKLAIAISIIQYEKKSRFREDMEEKKRKQDWYFYLNKRMTETMIKPGDFIEFKNNNISFITFNYDRSLEYFLYESYINTFNSEDEEKLRTCFKSFYFHHVFGKLAPLPWEGKSKFAYNYKRLEFHAKELAENIKTIFEEDEKSYAEIEIHNAINFSDRIFFLGFGYADENLKILGIPKFLKSEHKIYGTALGATKKEIKDIKNKLIDKPQFNGYDELKIENVHCRDLLRKYL